MFSLGDYCTNNNFFTFLEEILPSISERNLENFLNTLNKWEDNPHLNVGSPLITILMNIKNIIFVTIPNLIDR
jgi:hypothetical protein